MSVQKVDYELLEKDKQSILKNIDLLVGIYSEVNDLFLQISKNEIWTGKRSDSFFENFQALVNSGVDGNAIISKLEAEKIKIDTFMTDAINLTKLADDLAAAGITSYDDLTNHVASTIGAVNQVIHIFDEDTEKQIVAGITGSNTSGYKENKEKGFVITTGNKTYNLSEDDRELLIAIVAAECDKSADDALAVATTILNRCESPAWINSHGTNPIKQATAKNQFVVYQEGLYKPYMNGKAPDAVVQAVDAALGGVRNHNYLSFRSNGTTSYSNNMITSSGNRYK